MFLKHLSAAVLATCLAVPTAFAQTTDWKTVGDWQIVVDTHTKGCIMQKNYDNGILLQFGALPERNAGFFAVYRQDWTQIQHGRPVTVKFAFDGEEWQGTAQGFITKPWYGGFAEVDDIQVVYDFAKKYNMTIKGPNNTFELSLDGTFNGVKELEACQKAQTG